MWPLYLLLSLHVILTKSSPLYLPEMLPKGQLPLPLLQEELMRLQAMQVQPSILNIQQIQHLQDLLQLQTVPAMQQLQQLQDMQQLHGVSVMQQLQAVNDMQQVQVVPAIQQLQAMPMNEVQPILVLLPGVQKALDSNNDQATKRIKDKKEHKETIDENLESVKIEAEEPIPTIDDQKAILLMPNPRISINSIISAIPFLPFEINVPDTIAWMYNAIVSIIGQIQNSQSSRLKFKNIGNIGNFKKQIRPIIL